jgi:hypothetical protein
LIPKPLLCLLRSQYEFALFDGFTLPLESIKLCAYCICSFRQ